MGDGPPAGAPRAPGRAVGVRPARDEDARAIASLLYETAPGLYDRFAGSREAALRVLRSAFLHHRTNASREVIWVAEIDGQVAAALAAFPVEEGTGRARRFLATALLSTAPRRWPGAVRIFRLGGRAAPPPPLGALYVDALATSERFRRRGAARALLAAADERARAHRLSRVALETELDNDRAQALYESSGFVATARRAPMSGLPGFVAYVKELPGEGRAAG